MDKIIFCICGTRKVYEQVKTTISMLLHTQPRLGHIYAFVEDDFISTQPELITFINVTKFKPLMENNVNTAPAWWTYMIMTRCYFPALLPNEKKVLYLDLDVIVEQDVSEFWDIDLQGKEVAGAVDTKFYLATPVPYIKDVTKYINSGVLLMDLEKIRANGTDKKMDQLLHSFKMMYIDQDCINLCCDILQVDCRYNSGNSTGHSDNPLIIHSLDCKPWLPKSKWHNIWTKYHQIALRTKYYD